MSSSPPPLDDVETAFGPVKLKRELQIYLSSMMYHPKARELSLDLSNGPHYHVELRHVLSILMEDVSQYPPLPASDPLAVLRRDIEHLNSIWGEEYPVLMLLDINDTNLTTHMKLDQIQVNCGFEYQKKHWKRIGASKKHSRHDDDDSSAIETIEAEVVFTVDDADYGQVVQLPASTLVRPHVGGPRQPECPSTRVPGRKIPTPAEIRAQKQQASSDDAVEKAMQERIRQRILEERKKKKKDDDETIRVVFSAGERNEQGLAVDNLDKVCFQGKGVLTDYKNAYKSPVLDSPTWLDVCVYADEMLSYGDDDCGEFLESVDKTSHVDSEHGVPVYCMDMGS